MADTLENLTLVKIPKYEMAMFPKHIKPALSFNCCYCEYSDQSFKNVSIHVNACHPKKLDVKLRSRDPVASDKDVAVVNNAAYLNKLKPNQKKTKSLIYQSSEKTTSSSVKRGSKAFSCHLCHMKCDNQLLLDIHHRCHTGNEDKLVCCFCGKKAPSVKAWYGLYIHMVNRHPEEVPAPIQCGVCKKGFVKEWDLSKHALSHSNYRPFACDVCGEAYKSKINLRQHYVLRHNEGTDAEREKFLRRMKSRPLSRTHLPTLHCTVCQYRTKVRSKLITHAKIHNGIKDLQCPQCEYKTGDPSSLRRHMWTHRVRKPYNCQMCDFACIQRPQLLSHYKSKHGLSSEAAMRCLSEVHYQSVQQVENIMDHGLSNVDTITLPIQTVSVGNSTQTVTMEVNADNPVDIKLLTEAAEGLLAASQVELHTT